MSKQWIVNVTESIHHSFRIEAETAEEAEEKYFAIPFDKLKELDLDGETSWDKPWEIYEDK